MLQRVTMKPVTLQWRISDTVSYQHFRRQSSVTGFISATARLVATCKCDPSRIMRPSDQGYDASLTYYSLLWRPEIIHSMVIERLIPDCLITLVESHFQVAKQWLTKANYPRVEDLKTRCQNWLKVAHRKHYSIVTRQYETRKDK